MSEPRTPEVLTDHTDVICSTSIERIVTGRNAALTQIEALLHQHARYFDTNPQYRRKSRPGLGHETGFSLWLLAYGEA